MAQSYLGILWWIIEPLMYLGAFTVVFTKVFPRAEGPPFLLIGLVSWKWFASSLQSGCVSLINNGGLMKLVYMPKHVFPVVAVTTATIKFLFVFSLLIVFTLAWGIRPTAAWALIPVLIGLQLLLCLGVAMIAGGLIPFARDLRMLVDNLLLMLMFLSGVFYSPSQLSSSYQVFFLMNPVANMLEAYRSILIQGVAPDAIAIAVTIGYSLFFLLVGHVLLKRYDRVYPKLIS